ncbi:hypothetical protein Lalb_Chr02g0147241 [Lupinus albus]|uniref:Uncharacterized protein n=1 Tax=Lupinus albus TaxID=3870 RepID=A0A6A4QZS6_LUPAL|nr:hypothetical protein Lalb_Chr02g0147241 [Lupinus albus]
MKKIDKNRHRSQLIRRLGEDQAYIPFSLTCIVHKNYMLRDPITQEDYIM